MDSPSSPVKLLHFDMLLHEDAYAGCEPQLLLYDTAVEGMASVNDDARDVDRLDLLESLTMLGRHASFWAFAELPAYLSMLRFACEKMDWDLHRFRGYRTRIQYPVHGLQACMAFDVNTSAQ
jgi:hypothetical protein